MAKQKRKASVSKSENHQGHTFEEIFDDSLLPDATEIQKLSAIDPDIIQWLKERAEKEQEFRHNAFFGRMKMVSKSEKGSRWINYLGMYLSYVLITGGNEILGSIFSGAMLIAIASIFMSKVKSNNKEDTPRR